MTRTLLPPRIGSLQKKTGCSAQSDLSPGAWFVLDPSNAQPGRSFKDLTVSTFTTRVLLRSFCVGSVPSIQMYSAQTTMVGVPPFRLGPTYRLDGYNCIIGPH